ncbi:MAG: hypothetical protein EX285_07920 [Thaumarchaeota archaeon]|nr:hypothetical protein [Nitrososphaerota archaeon]
MAKRKIQVETDNSNWQAPKTRKTRKPMSEEQRAAAAKRLEKAREKRAEKNPNYGQSGIHPTLRDLPDEHNAHPKKVKQWIKTQKELASAERAGVKQGIKGAIARLANHEGYIRNCQKYLRDGDWVDDFFGEHQERKIQWRCLAMAYDQDGETKRKVGTYYPDIGMVYEGEVSNKDKGIENVRKERKPRKRSNNSRTVEKKKTKKT